MASVWINVARGLLTPRARAACSAIKRSRRTHHTSRAARCLPVQQTLARAGGRNTPYYAITVHTRTPCNPAVQARVGLEKNPTSAAFSAVPRPTIARRRGCASLPQQRGRGHVAVIVKMRILPENSPREHGAPSRRRSPRRLSSHHALAPSPLHSHTSAVTVSTTHLTSITTRLHLYSLTIGAN